MNYKWRVKKSERGLSLENFIYKQLGDWSHSQVKKAIDHKRAFINGRNVFVAKWNLKPNDLVLFVPVKNESPVASGGRYKFIDVLFEDSYIIVASKPAFVDYEDFLKTIQEYLKRKNHGQGYPYVGAMHRLDKETSGVMIFTKKKTANVLAEQFRDHTIQKFYVALAEGRVEKDEGTINCPVEKGQFEEGKKVRVAEDDNAGKKAMTRFRVLERYAKATLLKVEILTGRTHQIRVHMNHLGHPLVGDKLYGIENGIPFKRQALYAERLDFVHPITKKKMKVVAPMPLDMQGLIDELRMQS